MATSLLEQGSLSFSVESRVLRELGERLVKQPEVAIVELIKNAYDADATECRVNIDGENSISVVDDGSGMNLDTFLSGWMRIGTSLKEAGEFSEKFARPITGEKGIGRFAVRFLGGKLHLESIADDPKRKNRTRLVADFDWPQFDQHEDLGKVTVPYRLEKSNRSVPTGTTLVISALRSATNRLDLGKVRTSSVDVLSPFGSLLQEIDLEDKSGRSKRKNVHDPGFVLKMREAGETDYVDIATPILEEFTLRACLQVTGDKLDLRIYRRGMLEPSVQIVDTYSNQLRQLYADIRFFPKRKGAFANLPIDGRRAYGWIAANSGVAVFDRRFRVSPYGMKSDDWLQLAADAARNRRAPRSTVADKYFPMSDQERGSTSENWMLRLPQPIQLVGVVLVQGKRVGEVDSNGKEGLIASADREGFIENDVFHQLRDLIRGAVEAIAYDDRRLQQEQEQERRDVLLSSIREEARAAIKEIRSNPNIEARTKSRLIATLAQTQQLAEEQEETTRDRERQLEVMSLLGVVAGFMTHEFGVALAELEASHAKLTELGRRNAKFKQIAQNFSDNIKNLKDFVAYSSGYIQSSRRRPDKPYPAKPRLQQVKRIFGSYATERKIDVEIDVESSLKAPLVPVSLYNGISLNLYTNALKAITAKIGTSHDVIIFRAWNENQWHYLEVSDTGIGIPSALSERVFDPLFTTTQSQHDPLGSGMGLGLTLVKRSAEAFGGHAEVVAPPPGFSTCVRIRLPLQGGQNNE